MFCDFLRVQVFRYKTLFPVPLRPDKKLLSFVSWYSCVYRYNNLPSTILRLPNPCATIVAKNCNVDKLKIKLHMIGEEIRNKKNRVHAISASQLDDDIVIEENGWMIENKEYESEKEVVDIQDDGNDASLEQKIQRLERRQKRAQKTHGARLEHLKRELQKRQEESDKEAKKLNEVCPALNVMAAVFSFANPFLMQRSFCLVILPGDRKSSPVPENCCRRSGSGARSRISFRSNNKRAHGLAKANVQTTLMLFGQSNKMRKYSGYSLHEHWSAPGSMR
jgi:hypothetical protein